MSPRGLEPRVTPNAGGPWVARRRRWSAMAAIVFTAAVTAWAMTAAFGGGPSASEPIVQSQPSQRTLGSAALRVLPNDAAVSTAMTAPKVPSRPHRDVLSAGRPRAEEVAAVDLGSDATDVNQGPQAPLGLDGSQLAIANVRANTFANTWILPPAVLGTDPEARLLAAYQVLDLEGPAAALPLARQLVEDLPGFSLAHMLLGDLLATLAGQPRAFDIDGEVIASPDDRRIVLREEARRRWTAQKWRPPRGTLPLEFLQFAPEVRHAVAIDTSRSRLYLFENGPAGMVLKRDLYISVGRLGVGKQVEGDQRTPLGLYWVTSGFRAPMRDPRLGEAALGINYPNAWDRERGRTGRGLFLHGVPRHLLAHVPQATDGCVAMSNDDAIWLLQTLDPDTTPVLIAPQLQWVDSQQTRAFHRDFLTAHEGWRRAMRDNDDPSAKRWYGDKVKPVAWDKAGPAASPSILGWYGDGHDVVIVTSRHPHADGERPGWVRQYWVRQAEGWRIIFDGLVPVRSAPSRQDTGRRSAARTDSPRG